MSLNVGKRTIEYLQQHPQGQYTAREIAEWIFTSYPQECQEKKAGSQRAMTDAQLLQQVVREIYSQRVRLEARYPALKSTENRPRRFYYSEQSDSAEAIQAAAAAEEDGPAEGPQATGPRVPGEHKLYPVLCDYLWTELQVLGKRIDEKRSSNLRGPRGNQWLHPDVVGLEDLGAHWHREVRDCVAQVADRRMRLWSFEVKVLINRANVRETYFQAVSNSSWANFGYLVAPMVQGSDTLKELRMLYAAHGIGVIQLDTDTPSESEILIPARERPEIDWTAASRLASENKDMLALIKLVRQFHQTGEARIADWDVPADALERAAGGVAGS